MAAWREGDINQDLTIRGGAANAAWVVLSGELAIHNNL
jgi:hypothetical protein